MGDAASPLTWRRRSAGGQSQGHLRRPTGSPPSTPIRQQLTTLCDLRSPPRRRHRRVGRRLRGRSAGGGLAIAHPGHARDHGLPLPARGLRHVTVCRSSPWPGRPWTPARCRPAAQPRSPPRRVGDYHGGTKMPLSASSAPYRRPVRSAAPDHPGRKSRGPPRRRRPSRATGRHRRRRGHASTSPLECPSVPGLLPDP